MIAGTAGGRSGRRRLVVTFDARGVEAARRARSVKVLALEARDGTPGAAGVSSAPATFDPDGRGRAILDLPETAGTLRLLIGPGGAPDQELALLRTLSVEIPRRRWRGPELTLPPIRVPAYWWSWWGALP